MTHTPQPGPTAIDPSPARDSADPASPAPNSRHAPQEDAAIRKFAVAAARLIKDSHCEEVYLFDVRGMSDMTDYILIASGTSDRQIRAVASELEDLGVEHQSPRSGAESDEAATWIVLDFVDVVVHLFDPPTRAYYDLEMLWGDAPKVRWQR